MDKLQRQCIEAALEEMAEKVKRTLDRVKSDNVKAALRNDLALIEHTQNALKEIIDAPAQPKTSQQK